MTNLIPCPSVKLLTNAMMILMTFLSTLITRQTMTTMKLWQIRSNCCRLPATFLRPRRPLPSVQLSSQELFDILFNGENYLTDFSAVNNTTATICDIHAGPFSLNIIYWGQFWTYTQRFYLLFELSFHPLNVISNKM